ncbi:hypothetical protein Cch01nite_18390 [Cellulomonas chitinilytica]|uniref:Uncharacterized protein n=1 Tax=Cellulomonas chitinilytica TaxID=398759 RepID=A0A919P1V1_9CELL|nr:hypothetical protein [Cellulomonas chitinilytica]GIG21115.1 hypothetical protein Cch01nite_18390 [Cellulomonas chitinilytica]
MTAYPRPDFRVVDVPKSVVITQAIGTALALGALTPAIRTCWVFAVRIGLSLAATIALRQGMGLGYQILIVALGVIFFTFLEVALLGIARKPRVAQAVAGRQTFEGITLLPLHMFRFLLRCVEGLRLEFDTEGQALVSTMGESTEFVVEQNLKRQYVQKFDADSWPDAWAQIRSAKVGGTTFTAAMRSGILGTIYFAVRMASEVSAQLVATYFAIGSYFLSLAILEGDPLRLLQVTLVCGLGVAAFCFVAFTVGMRRITVVDPEISGQIVLPSERLFLTPESLDHRDLNMEAFRETRAYELLTANAGRTFMPSVKTRPIYIASVRNLTVRYCVSASIAVVLITGTALLVQWPLATLWSAWTDAQVTSWTAQMLVGFVALPVALTLSVLLGFWIVSQFNRFIAIIVGAVLTAVVPTVLAYAVGIESAEKVGLSALAAAAVGCVPLAVAELLKKQPGAATPREVT